MEKAKTKAAKSSIGGRKKLSPGEHLNKKLQIHVTESEKQQLQKDFEESGRHSISDYLRHRLLDKNRKVSAVNTKELLRHMDAIGTEIARIGNNMNQIAKYANSLALRGDIDTHPVKQFNKLMDEYLEDRRELVKAYRAVVKNF